MMDNAIARPHLLLRWRNWAQNLGRFLAQHHVTANDISLLGVMFAATAGAAFFFSPSRTRLTARSCCCWLPPLSSCES